MRIENDVKLDFCDVLIRPKRSEAASRSKVDLVRTFNRNNPNDDILHSKMWTGIPILAANMDTTGTFQMAMALGSLGVGTCLHKHYTAAQLIEFFNHNSKFREIGVGDKVFYTLGVTDDDLAKFREVRDKTVGHLFNVCIDVANGYSAAFVDKVRKFIEENPGMFVMAGNVATPDMVQELVMAGVDIVKVGIGPGSVCTTRLVSGVGYPQLSAIIECADAAHGLGGLICSDGGCKQPGDVSKAFGAGSDFVMLGGMLAGTDECDGKWYYDDDGKKSNLIFYGMSSKEAMDKYSGGVAGYRAAEGKCSLIPAKGPAKEVMQTILGGLRSACAYSGAMKLKDLSKCTTFVRVNRVHESPF